MAKPTVNTTTGVITFPNIIFNNTDCFKNILYKTMAIDTNSAINLNIKPTTADSKYSNIELKNLDTDSSYVISGYGRKQYTYCNATVYLMLQNGWNNNKIYDSQKNLMTTLLLGG
jgi:hypothetical protein